MKWIVFLLLLPALALAESGMYNFQGLTFNPDAPDSVATFNGYIGYWQETFGGSLTILPTGARISSDEESFGIGAMQGVRLWDQVVIGGGFLINHYDDKTDFETPDNYMMVRFITTVFLQDLSTDWHGRWGFGLIADYTPGMEPGKRKALTVGIVGLF
jgi:hypothetical protein